VDSHSQPAAWKILPGGVHRLLVRFDHHIQGEKKIEKKQLTS